MKKTYILLASVLVFTLFACNDNAANKIEAGKEAAANERDAKLAKYPKMTFEEIEFDFGDLDQGTEVEHLFEFTNTGDTPLVITNANSTCGCTIPEYTKEAVAPGEKGELLVKFDGTGSGRVSKTVTLTTNTERGNELIRIKANVRP